jgi:hypothetical protein
MSGKLMTLDENELVDPKTATEILKVGPNILSRWRYFGDDRIPFVKIGGRVRYKRSDLQTYLNRSSKLTFDEHLQQAEADLKKHEADMQTFEAEAKKASNERNAEDRELCRGGGSVDALRKAYAEMQQAEINYMEARSAKRKTKAKIKGIKSLIADNETSQYDHSLPTLA